MKLRGDHIAPTRGHYADDGTECNHEPYHALCL
jgi:hypothetical protein